MNRRDFFTTASVAAGAMASNRVFASDHKKGHKMSKLKGTLKSGDRQKLLSSVNKCIEVGEECLAHCAAMLASGDTSMGECKKCADACADCIKVCESLA